MEGQIEIQSNEELQKLKGLLALSTVASQAKDLPDLWEPLFDKILDIMKVDAGTLLILEKNVLVRKVARNMSPAIWKEPPIPLGSKGISSKVAMTRKPAIYHDLSHAEIASAVVAKDFHSLITVPMVARDQVLGVMSIFARAQREFTKEDLDYFMSVSNQAALAVLAIQSSKLLLVNQRRIKELEALYQVSRSITTLFNFEETLYSLVAIIANLFKADKCAIALFDKATNNLVIKPPTFGLRDDQAGSLTVASDQGIGGRAFCKGIPVVLNVIDKEAGEILQKADLSHIQSMAAVPLRSRSQSLGVLYVFSERPKNFTLDNINLLNILASTISVVIGNARLFQETEEIKTRDEAILESMAEGVYATNHEGKIILFNKSMEQMTGYPVTEAIGKNVGEIISFITKKGKTLDAQGLLQKVLQTLEIFEQRDDFYLLNREQETIPISAVVAPLKGAEGAATGSIVVCRDITKQLEAEEMKRQLINIATHELRAPITGIKGYLEMILDGETGQIPKETSDMLKEISQINQRLANLVDDLLNVGRIEEGRIEVKPAAFEYNPLISQTIGEMTIQAKNKGLQLIFTPTGSNMIFADKEKTREVLINLLSNAIKYTTKGEVKVEISRNNKEVLTIISDTGIGMSQEEQSHLFEKFYRARNETTRSVPGTGLGLWIVREILRLQKGNIKVESQKGVGTKVSFTLPIAEAKATV
jgi:PAS domain S-box-containing protein